MFQCRIQRLFLPVVGGGCQILYMFFFFKAPDYLYSIISSLKSGNAEPPGLNG